MCARHFHEKAHLFVPEQFLVSCERLVAFIEALALVSSRLPLLIQWMALRETGSNGCSSRFIARMHLIIWIGILKGTVTALLCIYQLWMNQPVLLLILLNNNLRKWLLKTVVHVTRNVIIIHWVTFVLQYDLFWLNSKWWLINAWRLIFLSSMWWARRLWIISANFFSSFDIISILTIKSLLNLESNLPLVRNKHVIVLQPHEVLSIATVWGKDVISLLVHEPDWRVLLNTPVNLIVNLEVAQPTALNIANLSDHVWWIDNIADKLDVFAVIDFDGISIAFQFLRVVYHTFDLVFASCILTEEPFLVRIHQYHCLTIVRQVLERAAPYQFHWSLTRYRATQPVRWITKSNMLSILEPKIIGATQSRYECVPFHFAGYLIVTGHCVQTINIFNEEVSDGWMMTGMLTVKFSPIVKLALQGFT